MMKRINLIVLFLLLAISVSVKSQDTSKTEVYLITCGPGTETYSVYGHSALRIVIPEKNVDLVYNWGLFDFSTPNFAFRFAKGNLDYMLGVEFYNSFLKEYLLEQRWVISQKINLDRKDTEQLFYLISENLRPENRKYRYDFYYDNCSTRIRDIIEKAIGENLIYPPEGAKRKLSTFRELTREYQRGYPWLNFGIDILIGTGGDKKASFRDRMFLPIELYKGLSELVVRRDGKMIPLLQNPETVVDFESPVVKEHILTSPVFIFSLLLIVLILITGFKRGKKFNNILDISIFTIYSILAILMIFFNLFSAHEQLKSNLNIFWLNPFILICLLCIILGKNWKLWFRVVFYLALAFLTFIFILPQAVNNATLPLVVILILRSSVRAGFKWNPFSLPHLTEL